MFGKKKQPKEKERFYLLPGQGGRNFHRKQKVLLTWTVVVSLLFGGLLALVMWWFSKPRI